MSEETVVDWDGEQYSKASIIQHFIAWNFINSEKFRKIEKKHENELFLMVDIGCGDGRITKGLFERFITFPNAHVYGIDLSEGQISHAQKTHTTHKNENNTNLDFALMDATKLDTLPLKVQNFPFPSIENKVDKVTSFTCLHWIVDHHLLFQQIFNALKKGGEVDITFPWDLEGNDEVNEKTVNHPLLSEFIPKNYEMIYFHTYREKNKLLAPFFDNNEQISGGGNDGSRKPDDVYINAYRKMLLSIGFSHVDVALEFPKIPAEHCYKSIEEMKIAMSPWLPYSRFIPDDKPELKDIPWNLVIEHFLPQLEVKSDDGQIVGYAYQLPYVHLHLNK